MKNLTMPIFRTPFLLALNLTFVHSLIKDMLIEYLKRVALFSLQEIGFVIVPPVLLGMFLYYVSKYFRNRFAGSIGVDPFMYLTAIGVAIHELGHAFFAILFGHKITKIVLFRPHAAHAGCVNFSQRTRGIIGEISKFFIGVAPIIFGALVIYITGLLMFGRESVVPIGSTADLESMQDFAKFIASEMAQMWRVIVELVRNHGSSDLKIWIFLYLVFAIGSHMQLSKEDLKAAGRGFLCLILTIFLFNLVFGWWHGLINLAYLQLLHLSVYLTIIMLFALSLNIAISSALLLIVNGVRSIFGK